MTASENHQSTLRYGEIHVFEHGVDTFFVVTDIDVNSLQRHNVGGKRDRFEEFGKIFLRGAVLLNLAFFAAAI